MSIMSLTYSAAEATISDIVEVNSSFATGKLKIMYTGSNRNTSNIPREVVEAAIPTLYNIPIVAHYNVDDNEIGGHDMQVVKTEDGGLRLRNLTEPCGVITDHTKVYFETDTDANGVEHEYLIADGVVLWKRQEVVQHIISDLGGVVDHSMEIDVTAGNKNSETGLFDVKAFEFEALCLLGGDNNPCFEGSSLELFSASDFKKKMEEMMNELKENYFTALTEEKGGQTVEINANTTDTEKKYTDQPEDTEGAEQTSANAGEETPVEGAATENASQNDDNSGAEHPDDNGTPATTFALASNMENELIRASEGETFIDPWGDKIKRYSLRDYDAEKSEAYFLDRSDWTLCAMSYSLAGDAVVIDFDSKRRVKIAYVDYEDNRTPATPGNFSLDEGVLDKAKAAIEESEKLSALLKQSQDELDELRKFKLNAEGEALIRERNAIAAKFSSIANTDEFTALVESANEENFTADKFEEKCYALLGKMCASENKTTASATKIVFDDTAENDDSEDPYGGIVTKYTT